MTRKYTKKDMAYWNSLSSGKKTKITVKRSSTIFHDKGKHSSLKIVANLKDPVYRHKRG